MGSGSACREVLERALTPRGEFLLRRAGDRIELIANGVFLMDSDGGTSERLLVEVAVAGLARPDILIGGLGFGASIDAALAAGPCSVTVVEHEPLVVDWFARHLPERARPTLGDPRVCTVVGDFATIVTDGGRVYDAICADIDNGPDLLVRSENAAIYRESWLAVAADRLRPGGRLAIWCASANDGLERALATVFGRFDAFASPASRGAPDVVYRAGPRGPRRSTAPTHT
jgi:spermidine synthase